LLDLLRDHGAAATFFVLGERIDGHHDLLVRMRDEGHELGNHTWSHPHALDTDEETLHEEIARTSAEIERVSGVRPRVLRPPYGEGAARFARLGAELGLESHLWTISSLDWRNPPPEAIVERVLDELQPGAVVLLHDGSPRYDETTRESTVAAVALLLPELERRGYAAVPISAL
jgi:peptidoglycan-N-acetylglucosamine deacetylase